MHIDYFYQWQDDKPMRLSGEVLFNFYVQKNPTIRDIYAPNNGERVEIDLSPGSPIYAALIIEPGPPMKVTYRSFISRMR